MGLWQKIRSVFVRDDEPSLDRDDDPYIPLVPYPTAELDHTSEDREGTGAEPQEGAP
jgi:hypothetical protein